ncbi:MAG TPA: hypothetical protein VGM62_02880, partial [Chthoniobacterales bacterium]
TNASTEPNELARANSAALSSAAAAAANTHVAKRQINGLTLFGRGFQGVYVGSPPNLSRNVRVTGILARRLLAAGALSFYRRMPYSR